MKKNKNRKSTIARGRVYRAITEEHYEKGNNRRCYHQVWRRYIYPIYGCCYRTYLNGLALSDLPIEEEKSDPRELLLFD